MAKYIATNEDEEATHTAQRIDFDEINAKLMGNIEAHCHQWLPGGKVKGGSYRIGGIDGSMGSSMSINLRTGQWYDHATEDKGGDLISLYAATNNLTQGEAASELQGAVNIVRMAKTTKRKPVASESDWEHALTKPEAPAPEHWEHGQADIVYKYADAAGRPVGVIMRWDLPDGSKTISQCSWMRHKKTDRCTWKWQAFNAPRPLYKGELLNKKPGADVVIVEGEKAADALASKLPDHVVLSWAGGSKAINQSDWAVLEGRKVSIWADNDEPGRTAAKQLQGITKGNLIDAPSDKAEGWDAADAVAEGWTTEGLKELIANNVERQTFNVRFGNEGAPRSLEEAKARRPDVIIDGLLYAKSKLLIGGVAKAGKSHCHWHLAWLPGNHSCSGKHQSHSAFCMLTLNCMNGN
jgi:putative DNA primase/helicase